jgi:hypothetical protein
MVHTAKFPIRWSFPIKNPSYNCSTKTYFDAEQEALSTRKFQLAIFSK